MNITVIVCTYNRCQALSKALSSVAASVLPASLTWEVLVVDNNSSDQTREVVDDFCRRYPDRFRYLFEPRQGKSRALNTGIKEARGEILAFVDDDVVVESAWLRNLTASLDDGHWGGAGGRILPDWSAPPPPWLPITGPYDLRGMLALFDIGENPCELDRPPFGTNMAFRKTAFEKYGGFRTDLGPTTQGDYRQWYSAAIPRGSEDTEFGGRLMAAGEHLRYEPSAIIYHPVPPDRLTKGYFLAFWFDHGRASVCKASKKPDVCGVPRYYLSLVKAGALLAVRTLAWMLVWNSQARFYRKGWVWMTAGQIKEYYRQALHA
jgi:glycosyltransferase involved in cell wall biosynthesis